MTGGNYHIVRTTSYPDFPSSKIVTDAVVKATTASEWDTKISINGRYDGPKNVISVQDYQLVWRSDGKSIIESGGATLVLSSGKPVRQVWSSTITPDRGVDKFPASGELLTLSITPFQVSGNGMSYTWTGSVKVRPASTR